MLYPGERRWLPFVRCDLPDFLPNSRPIVHRVHRGNATYMDKRAPEGEENLRTSIALGYHRIPCHEEEEFSVTVKILEHEVQTSARKALEAWTPCRSRC